MPGWAIALIAVVAGVFLVMVLAAVAIPTFLDQRVRAHTPQIPDRIGELTRSGDASLQRETQAVADQAVNQRGRQGAAFVDATGTRQVFVYTGAFVTPKSQAELAEYERGYWQGISSSLPEGYVVGPATAQPSLTYDGLMTCSFVLADEADGQVPVRRACLALDPWSSVSTIDLSATGEWDPALIDTVREAVQPR